MLALATMNVPAALGSIGLITLMMVLLFVGARRDEEESSDEEKE